MTDLSTRISDELGLYVTRLTPLTGGCVGEVYRADVADGPPVAVKVDRARSGTLPREADMLRYLKTRSRLPVPDVLFSSDELLLMTLLPGSSRFSANAERHAAELLAELHDVTAEKFGFEYDTRIGGLIQPNLQNDSWIAFFRDQRLLAFGEAAVREGVLASKLFGRIEKLCARLADFIAEPPRPSLLHGDVWTTNVLAEGDRVTGFIDPAIYYGHPEAELAFVRMLGTFGRAFYDRYRELRPIEPGFFETRCGLYNLYPMLVHVRLGYSSYAESAARELAKLGF
jgi:fructosamine-3-kinase